ncbi:hypothetical protein OAE97_00365 [Verrucomicrobia bacterium]|nr:hypothetical protein [Verrucomicrobiota bacterium]
MPFGGTPPFQLLWFLHHDFFNETPPAQNYRSRGAGGVWEVLSRCRMTIQDYQGDQPESDTVYLKWLAWWRGEGETVEAGGRGQAQHQAA